MSSVRDVETHNVNLDTFTMNDVEANIVRCPDAEAAERMIAAVDEVCSFVMCGCAAPE